MRRAGSTTVAVCVLLPLLLRCTVAASQDLGALELDAAGCVQVALRGSAELAEAEAKVQEWLGRLAEVESAYYPKLSAVGYVAPMFTVRGSALEPDVERRYGLRDWGPYTHLQALLAQPLYSFGRVEAGERAAAERLAVERARLDQARSRVAVEVHRLYFTHLFARSMLPSLENAARLVDEAEKKGAELYEQGGGQVTQSDLMKLRYAATEVQRYVLEARDGAELALSALKHTMGLAEEQPLKLKDEQLPGATAEDVAELPLADLLAEARSSRPEWRQAEAGARAAAALASAERRANLPVLFAAGQLTADWTPQRDDSPNPYHHDPYNQVVGGVAVGLQFELDPGRAHARARQAEAMGEQVAALSRQAATGIPLQVRKAHQELQRYRQQVALGEEAVRATRRWMAFAGAAYTTGTGEAKDLLEGVVAYLSARRTHYESLKSYHIARAELDQALGRTPKAAQE